MRREWRRSTQTEQWLKLRLLEGIVLWQNQCTTKCSFESRWFARLYYLWFGFRYRLLRQMTSESNWNTLKMRGSFRARGPWLLVMVDMLQEIANKSGLVCCLFVAAGLLRRGISNSYFGNSKLLLWMTYGRGCPVAVLSIDYRRLRRTNYFEVLVGLKSSHQNAFRVVLAWHLLVSSHYKRSSSIPNNNLLVDASTMY
jgi:hypothetical protein